MPFSERSELKDESRPLLRDPVWQQNYRYGGQRGRDPEIEELLGLENPRSQRFQWFLFMGVTFLSVIILLGTMGVLIKLNQNNPIVDPTNPSTPLPFSKPPTTATTANSVNPSSTITTTTASTTTTSTTATPSSSTPAVAEPSAVPPSQPI